MNDFVKYKNEAKERWGETEAYKEHAEKTKYYSDDKWQTLSDSMNVIFEDFASCMKSGFRPGSDEAQRLVKKLQNYITENYYTCTNEILAGLGQMYLLDERFKENIDKHGDLTAEFVSTSIGIYCSQKN